MGERAGDFTGRDPVDGDAHNLGRDQISQRGQGRAEHAQKKEKTAASEKTRQQAAVIHRLLHTVSSKIHNHNQLFHGTHVSILFAF